MRPDNSDLAAIVARLERQLRTIKLALGATVLVVGGLALTGWTSPQDETVTAQRFMVLDVDGIPRGMFGVLADGASVGMMFTDLAGAKRIELGTDPDGTPRLALWDDQERLRADIGMNADGAARIVLADPSETGRAALSVGNDGSAQMVFIDANGSTNRAMIGTLGDGRSVLLIYDDEGQVLTQLPANMGPVSLDTTSQR